jgi:hypothetical protein
MKLFKIAVCAVAFSVVGAPAFAEVGKMTADDMRAGQLLCPQIEAKLESHARERREADRTELASQTGASQASSSAN